MRPERLSVRQSGGSRFKAESGAWLTIPNLLTLFRLVLIAPFGWLCIRGHNIPALFVFLIAGITDTLDGTLARRFNQRSKFGRLADPIADKLLTTVSFLALSLFRQGRPAIPLWVTIAVIGRDALILIGSFVVYVSTGSTAFQPGAFGKVNTFIELGTIVLVLVSARLAFLAHVLSPVYFMLILSLILSTTAYVLQGLRTMRMARAGST
ncbi:MAG: CDP-alcohol phosphatidyltransferase family protein [Acidobacteriaceae bacterium]|nr:CDP-alcohol phosphatidyltransferase family protein [Acidobacteriaceae bacterium]